MVCEHSLTSTVTRLMHTYRFAVAATVALLLHANTAQAQTLTFNDLDCGFGTILETYQGFSFENTDCFDGSLDEELGSGFFTVGGGSNVIYGASDPESGDFVNALPFGFFRDTPFTFQSFRAAAGWRNGLSLTVEGFLMGSLVHNFMTVLAGPASPELIELNWSGIDQVRFSTSGGTNAEIEFDGTHVALDDLVFTPSSSTVIPEPATSLLVLPALAGVAFVQRRRRTRA